MILANNSLIIILAQNFRKGSNYGKFKLNGLHRDQSPGLLITQYLTPPIPEFMTLTFAKFMLVMISKIGILHDCEDHLV